MTAIKAKRIAATVLAFPFVTLGITYASARLAYHFGWQARMLAG